jgi:dihydroorotate dehydrogenase electron transfer subunit
MSKVFNAEITEKRLLPDGAYIIGFRCPELAKEAKPGQFVMVRPSTAEQGLDPITPRPYGILAIQHENNQPVGFLLVVKVLGKGGASIVRHEVGETLQVNGPRGQELEIDKAKRYLLVAGGTGIAPVLSAAQAMKAAGVNYKILYGGQVKDAVYIEEIQRLGFEAVVATDDGSLGQKGLVTLPLKTALAEDPDQVVFACGPWGMMRACTDISTEFDAECYVSLERYMACGFGVCLACVYQRVGEDFYRTCCKEGPVVKGAEVNWDA